MLNKQNITIRCIAEGCEGSWTAACLDFDLAVQGASFSEVYKNLNDAIYSYLETVSTLPKDQQEAFLNRRAPFLLRAKFMWAFFCSYLFDARSARRNIHGFVEHAPCFA